MSVLKNRGSNRSRTLETNNEQHQEGGRHEGVNMKVLLITGLLAKDMVVYYAKKSGV